MRSIEDRSAPARPGRLHRTAFSLANGLTVCAMALGLAAIIPSDGARAADCKPEDIPAAVDATGAALRKYTMETQPELQPRLKALSGLKGWGEEGYEDQAFAYLRDDKLAKFDETASELLARIDALGELKQGESPDCSKVEGIKAAGVELLAVMKAKTNHVMTKIDTELGRLPSTAKANPPKPLASPPERQAAPATPPPTSGRNADQAGAVAPTPATPQATAAAPATSPKRTTAVGEGWSTKTETKSATAPPAAPPTPAPAAPTPGVPYEPGPAGSADATIAMQRPGDGAPRPSEGLRRPAPAESLGEDGYTIQEIHEATRGFFGPISTGLASVIEHAFRKSGRPTGYVLGIEGGGAFIGGLRYGKGTLYLRSGGTETVYWHGPSLGFDFGASGTRTMFLVYKLRERDDIYRTFTGIDGSAFVVGGVGITLLAGGDMVLAPIRSGLGVRLGASIGYIRFTPKATWVPL